MKTFKEYAMTSRQQITQMRDYWKDLDHMASDVVKKKSMDRKFGIRDIKLDKKLAPTTKTTAASKNTMMASEPIFYILFN